MRAAHFYLKLKPEELLEYYQGRKSFVRVHTYEGYSIQFRAEHLRQWVTAIGINGEFQIRFDEQNKFAGLFLYRDLSGTIKPHGASASTSGTGTHSSTKSSTTGSPASPSGTPSRPNQRPRGFKKSI